MRIIPALAGNTRRRQQHSSEPSDHPRSRGEYSSKKACFSASSGSSPLSRGILGIGILHNQLIRIIPALAGNTIIRRHEYLFDKDHPRSRGEYSGSRSNVNSPLGSSPLSRGIHVHASILPPRGGIIPALAGNTGEHLFSRGSVWDHPRSRGEYPRR